MNAGRKFEKRDRVLSQLTVWTIVMLLLVTFASLACNRGHHNSPTTPPAVSSSSANLQVQIETRTNGEDADVAPGPTVTAGKMVTWTYRIRNAGSDTLSSIAVSDDVLGDVTCPGDTLLAGEAMTCRETGVATVGQYANLATVMAAGDSGATATATDPSHYLGKSGSGGGGGGGGGSTPPGNDPEGCGPGFWKNNADKHGASAWVGYTPSMTLASAGFANDSGLNVNAFSMRDALGFSGGPTLVDWEKNMVKHAVTALLNAASPGVNYPWSTGLVLSKANTALATNNLQALNAQKDEFESMNSAGCPLE